MANTYGCFAKSLATTAPRSWGTCVFVAITVSGYEEQAVAVRRKTHSTHPDTALSTTSVLVPDISLGHQRAGFHGEACCNLFGRNVDSNDKTGIVEEIAVTPERAINVIPNLDKGRPLQDRSSNEVGRWPIVTG